METLRFENLSQYLLLKNGNYLYKVPFRGGWAVLKVYYGDRSFYQYVSKSLGNYLVCNQTSFMPKGRRKVELETLKIWKDAGFRVFGTYDDVVVEGLPEGGYTMFEYVPGTQFVHYFSDKEVSVEDKIAMWRRFVPEWYRRHKIAVETPEPRLAHENGDLKHVMIYGDELVYFDFEMVYRSKSRIKEWVAREILSYLKSLGKSVGADLWDVLMKETVELYEGRDLLEYTHNFAYRNPNLFVRAGRSMDRAFRPRAKKEFSKYSVASKLQDYLAAE